MGQEMYHEGLAHQQGTPRGLPHLPLTWKSKNGS